MIISKSVINRISEPQVRDRGHMSTLARARGFTLVEVMVAVTLLSLAMASLIATFLVFSKGIASLDNYSQMSASSRQTLEHFSRDAHAAQRLITADADEFEFELPDDAGGYIMNYKYDSTTRKFTREKYNGETLLATTVLFEDIVDFSMIYYNQVNVNVTGEPSILIEAKSVQIDAKLVKNVMNQSNTDHIISARFLMRNM